MSLQQILDFLKPFESLLKPELLKLEAAGLAELKTVIEGVQSPDLKLLFELLAGAIDQFAQAEINKLP